MSLLNNYQNDLLKSRTTSLLIELSKKDLDAICKDEQCGLLTSLAVAKAVYDTPLKDTRETNIIYIDADNAKNIDHIFLLEEFLDLISDYLKYSKNLEIVKESITAGLSFAIGGIFKEKVGGIIGNVVDMISENISDIVTDGFIDSTFEAMDMGENIANMLYEQISELLNDTTVNFLDTIKENNLYLSSKSKKAIKELSKHFKEDLTPAESFRFILELILSVAIDMPTLLYVKKPHKLDKDSLAILSLLYSVAKDAKDLGKHTGLSVVYAYEDAEFQPYCEVKEEYQLSKQLLDEQRLYTQRYAMLERPTSDIPHITVKSSMFVGREKELENLNERYNYSKEHPEIVTLEIISGEPGVGKTKLVKKHLTQIRSEEKNNLKQIQLTLLNQVGHTSSNTGLSSLTNAIIEEANRLETVKTLGEKIKDKSAEYIFGAVTDAIKSTLGVGATIDIGGAIKDRLVLDGQIEKITRDTTGDIDNKSQEKKEQQFRKLNDAIKLLQQELSDESMPIVLFIDDLQWIDEDSSEYLLNYFIEKFNVHIVATIRPSDATTVLKKLELNKEQYRHTIAFLIKAGIQLEEEIASKIDIQNIKSQTIKLQGLDELTLTDLISQVIKPTEEGNAKQKVLAQTIIKELNNDKTKDEVNTLFAVETINMLCDEKLYTTQDKDKQIEQLIVTKELDFAFNTKLKDFQESLNRAFKILNDKYKDAFEHINATKDETEFKQKFNLMAYAVLEERLNILKIYFAEHGNAAVNTLLFSSLLGTPFNSTIVKNILQELSTTDEELLQPLKVYIIKDSKETTLTEAQYEIIEEVYEILSRYVAFTNSYEYRHSLLNIFLEQQLNYILNTKIQQVNIAEAKDRLFILIFKSIHQEEEKQFFFGKVIQDLDVKYISQVIFYKKIYNNVVLKAYLNNPNRWAKKYVNSLNNLANLLQKDETTPLSNIGVLLEEGLKIANKYYTDYDDDWLKTYLTVLDSMKTFFIDIDYIDKAVICMQKAVLILKTHYEKQPEIWAEEYTNHLDTLYSYYDCIYDFDEKIDSILSLCTESLEVKRKLYKENSIKWAKGYIENLSKCIAILKRKEFQNDAIALSKESLEITRKLYNQDPDQWADQYITDMNGLAFSLKQMKQYDEMIILEKEALDVLKNLYIRTCGRWETRYKAILKRFIEYLENTNNINDVLSLKEEFLEATKVLYLQDSKKWKNKHLFNIENFATSLTKAKKYNLASKYFREYFQLVNFHKEGNITWFIYPFVKWYQCEVRLEDSEALTELDNLATKLITVYKNRLGDKYDDIIMKEEVAYRELADGSDDFFDKEKYEIFKRVFIKNNLT